MLQSIHRSSIPLYSAHGASSSASFAMVCRLLLRRRILYCACGESLSPDRTSRLLTTYSTRRPPKCSQCIKPRSHCLAEPGRKLVAVSTLAPETQALIDNMPFFAVAHFIAFSALALGSVAAPTTISAESYAGSHTADSYPPTGSTWFSTFNFLWGC